MSTRAKCRVVAANGNTETMRRTLLVTNDFPPKVGGIQNYLWELWRRLPADDVAVYTTPHKDAAAFDARQKFPIERSPEPVLLPYPWLIDRIRRHADDNDIGLILLDPAVPLGIVGPELGRPYGVILHGAEVTIPGRVPGLNLMLRRVLRGADLVVAGGEYAAHEALECARQPLPTVVVPPGVDSQRFAPVSATERTRLRDQFGIGDDDIVVATVNRLVPRKGMAMLIKAAATLGAAHPNLRVLIGGTGRQEASLQRLIDRSEAPVRLLGRLSDEDVVGLYGAADIMAMLCSSRWFGLEQEGFGIVFLEGAAMGLPQIAGRSGGASEAVIHDQTGLIVDDPLDVAAVARAIQLLIDNPDRRAKLGAAALERARSEFDYDLLASRLATAIDAARLT